MVQEKNYDIPPRGWNSFDYYDTCVTEEDVIRNAKILAEHFLPYGYQYVVVDIQWYAHGTGTQRDQYEYIPFSKLEMDEYGRLMPVEEKFPSAKGGTGFKTLADYIHSLGLKFGIHIMRGIPRSAVEAKLPVYGTDITADQIADAYSICNWNPDMYGVKNTAAGQKYYDSLIDLYSQWGVDFVKCDDMAYTELYHNSPDAGFDEMILLDRAIKRSGRDIVLSVSPGPAIVDKAEFYMQHSNMWRLSGDFWDNWTQLRKMFDLCEAWQEYVSPGHYPDCDMLPVGTIGKYFPSGERESGLSAGEQQTMMTLWAMIHSPFMVGAELSKMDPKTYALLTNEHILALDSDGYKGRQVEKNNSHAIWVSNAADGNDFYIAAFNFRDFSPILLSVNELVKITGKPEKNKLTCHNVWTDAEVLPTQLIETMPHGVTLIHVK